MKKILLLGGSAQQIPAIICAKDLGYYTILCDYLEDNPGQHYADKFYSESTTDKEKILAIARENDIDGIIAYASDPAAPTAAYVAEKLSLPTNPYKSVEIMANKHLFREFLSENEFCVPQFLYFRDLNEEKRKIIEKFRYPVMVKPVDSSGSKGITCANHMDELEEAIEFAKSFSKKGVVQVEEYIQKDHLYLAGGDIFVYNGQIALRGLMNCKRDNTINSFLPVGKIFPLSLCEDRVEMAYNELQRLLHLLEIKFGEMNVELLFNAQGQLYIIELAPRCGGNMIPELLQMISGHDLITANIECAMGNTIGDLAFSSDACFCAMHVLYVNQDGVFRDITFEEELKKYLVRSVIYKKTGDIVQCYDNASKAIGIVFMKFNSEDEMYRILFKIRDLIVIDLI